MYLPGLTTQQHPEGAEVRGNDWVRGGAQQTSYISPWYVATIKHSDLDRQQGELAEAVTETAVTDLHTYTATA